MKELTQEYLKEILYYDQTTGIFRWKKQLSYRGKVGEVAGCVNKLGYIVIRIDRKLYTAHRLAFLCMEDKLPNNHVDHIDLVKYNNAWNNLRHCTASQNLANTTTSSLNISGIKGLSYGRGFWRASITCNKIQYTKQRKSSFDCEDTKLQLANWLVVKRKELHKEFTNHG